MPPFPTQNSRQNFLKISFPQHHKGVDKTMISVGKMEFQSRAFMENWKVLPAISIDFAVLSMFTFDVFWGSLVLVREPKFSRK